MTSPSSRRLGSPDRTMKSHPSSRRACSEWALTPHDEESSVKPQDKPAPLSEKEGHKKFGIAPLYEGLEGSKLFIVCTIGLLILWSVACVFFSQMMLTRADDKNEDGWERWFLEDMENCKRPLYVIGTLFVFALVFRFNTCYDRWWDGRVLWGDVVSRCLDLNMMNRRWIADRDLGDRLSRFTIAYAYACKALLRGKSLADEVEDGKALVKRGILTQEELAHICSHPCWQPHFCLEMIRAIVVEAHQVPEGKGMVCDEKNKIHGQFFRCFDGVIKEMTKVVGDLVRTRASGLPATYDAVTMTSFFLFFIMAAFIWSASIGWMTPVIIGYTSFVSILLIVMGSKLVDPFGYDKVDIPLEAVCATIEAQIHAMDERHKSGVIDMFATTSDPRASKSFDATFYIPNLN